jgi:hypothetical protein
VLVVLASISVVERSLGVFATAQAAADAISNPNTSPKNENPDAAHRRRHRGNSVCPQEAPSLRAPSEAAQIGGAL